MDYPTHQSARCGWCQLPLIYIEPHWWCQTVACRTRQRAAAIGHTDAKTRRTAILNLPTPFQVEAEAITSPYLLLGGALGSQKSHTVRWMLYKQCLSHKNYEALILRRTFPELEKTHLRRMSRDADALGADYIEGKRLMRFPATGSLIEAGHMDDPDAVSRYLSSEYDCIVVDEGSTFDPDALLELSTRTVKRKKGGRFIVASNPGGPASGMLLDFFIDHQPDLDKYPNLRTRYKPEEWVYLPARLDDNPYLEAGYEDTIAVTQGWRYEQLRHGDWRIFAGQFFGAFNERRHVQDWGTPTEARWFRSLDWGFNAPGCWGWWAILPDGRLYKRRDYKFRQETVSANATKVKEITADLGVKKITYNVGDPSIWIKTGQDHSRMVGQSIGETFGKYGLHLIKADNDRYNGWMRMQDCLREAPDGLPWLILHPDCRYTIRSLAQAVSDKKDPDDVDTESDDHALDETRYGISSRPSVSRTYRRRDYADGTMGALKQAVRPDMGRLGSESVRSLHG